MTYFNASKADWAQVKESPDNLPCPCGGAPASLKLAASYFIQTDENWCGPTAINTIGDYLGVERYGTGYGVSDAWTTSEKPATQQSKAAALAIDPSVDGTDWEGNDGVPIGSWSSKYPMQDVLNFLMRDTSPNFYDITALPDSPTSTQIHQFEGNLVYDINDGNGWPLAANEYASPGYYLPGQSDSGIIQHWLAPTGYASSGATTVYEDPGWGHGKAVSVGSTSFVVALGGRGYVF